MLLKEPIEFINKQLERKYGKYINGMPNWRVVFSEDQFEKRLGTYSDFTPEGIFLREVTEVREAPKYRQWVHEKYILEGLTLIPEINQAELPVSRLSYELMWVFEDGAGGYLPPRFDACIFIIDTTRENQEGHSVAKHKDPDSDPQQAIANREQRIKALQEELFGDATEIGDALSYKQGIIVPSSYGGK